MNYTLIDNSADLEKHIAAWNVLERIAVDFECEFNLHIYGEHLCLIQIFDGTDYYIIDPRSGRLGSDTLCAFFTSPVRKVWFDCQSDNALVYKKYGVSISNIVDIRVYALTLGFRSNLASLKKEFLSIEEQNLDPAAKKRLQQTNWVRRPLSEEQVAYALSDVTHLFALEDVLEKRVAEAGLTEECAREMKKAVRAKTGKPGWVNLGPWRIMTKEQRLNVKQYYIARDNVARRFNVPSYHVLDKHVLRDFAMSCPKSEAEVLSMISSKASPRFQSQLRENMLKAFQIIHSSQVSS